MLDFEGKPKFLNKYALVGFDMTQMLGDVGELQIDLHPRNITGESPMKAYASVQESLGDEVTCKIEDWRFVGKVVGIVYNSASNGFRLTLQDDLAGFASAVGSNVFAEKPIRDIVSAVAPGGNIEYLSGFGDIKVKLAIQYQESPFRFLKRILTRLGGQIWCDGVDIFVGVAPTSKSEKFKLEKDVTDFQMVSLLGPESVELESIPYAKNNQITSKIELKGGKYGTLQDGAVDLRAKGDDTPKTFHIVHEDAGYDDAKHLGNSFLRSRASGRFSLFGRAARPVRLGSEMKIEGIGAGAGTETTIVRRIMCLGDYSGREVVWHFEAVNPEAVFSQEERPSDSLIVSTAVVDGTDDDLNRVTVHFPWDKKQQSTPWLRMTAPSWGKEHVHFLPPKIGDTVLVVWGQSDMDPIVMGSVTAGDKVGQADANLVLQTPDGQTITIDKNNIEFKNDDVKVNMDKSTVLIDTGGSKINLGGNNIELKTSGSITIEGTSGIALKTTKLDVG